MFVRLSCIFMEIVTSCHANFKVSELSLLEFTAFIMACPASVHQLKKSEPYLTWLGPKLQNWCIPHSFFLYLVFSPWHTEVRGLSLTCTSKASLSYLTFSPCTELSWFTDLTQGSWCCLPSCENRACSVHSTFYPHPTLLPVPCSLPLVQDGDYITSIPALHKSWKILGLMKIYFKKNFILKKLYLLIRAIQ